ncbi:hypothetical protein IT400_04280 [Candidatus Nomurabacteria bacterium]|nr:hypothetical protein [Candidatus Nomurabacteria bacterium]
MKLGLRKWIKTSIFIFSFTFIVFFAMQANAGKDDNVFGWWWSDGIGWISLNNCSDPTSCSGNSYGVNINEDTNIISGHAWSDNIGWISFDQNDWSDDSSTVGPPGGFSSSGNQIGSSGWGRALNGRYFAHSSDGRDNRGGYDGWISLSGFGIDKTTDLATSLGSAFDKKVVNPLTGYGWGSNVIGWVQATSKYHKSYVSFDKKCLITDPTCAKHDHSFFEVTINSKNTATIVGGDVVNIDWEAKQTFYPTECTGSLGGNSSPYPDSDWTTKTSGWTYQTQSGTYNKIHVPPSGATTFRLTCTDNTNVYYDEVNVNASFTAGINGGACIDDLTSNPTITWTTNDPSPECVIEAMPFYADFTPYTIPSSGYLNASGSAPYTVVDTTFSTNNKNTFYKLNCRNGDTGTYEANVGPITSFTKMCSNAVDYTITKSPSSCNYLTETSDPTVYKADTMKLTLIPENFTADTDVSIDTTNGTPKGNINWAPSSQQFTYNTTSKDHNTIDADYTISFTELSKKIKSTTYNSSLNGYLIESIDLNIKATSQNTDTKKESLLYCYATCDPSDPTCKPCDPKTDPLCAPKPKTKPKYVPF